MAGAGFAQTNAASGNPSPGLLGHRYAELGVGIHDLKFAGDNAYPLGAAANLSAIPSLLDVGLSYAYDWIGGPTRTHRNTFAAAATAYTTFNGMKPFSGLAMGWHTGGFGADDQALWGATLRVEIPVANLASTPHLNYADDFQDKRVNRQQWSRAVDASIQVDSTTSLFVSVGRSAVIRSPDRSWDDQAGVRVRF